MQTHPPKGSIVQVILEGNSSYNWHGFPINTFAIRVTNDMKNGSASYSDSTGFTQWLHTDSIAVIQDPPSSVEGWDIQDYIAYLKQQKLNPVQSSVDVALPLHKARPKTQKGRGLFILTQYGHVSKQAFLVTPKALPSSLPSSALPWFARPCPSRPRHGFVNSRVVKTAGELKAVLDETLAHDPHGEVVCMPAISAKYSAVVTDNMIAIGPGTDGATSGQQAIQIPCQSNLEKSFQLDDKYVRQTNGFSYTTDVTLRRYLPLKATEQLFVETVGDKLVQLRTGPQMAADLNQRTRWSPAEFVRCQCVFEVRGDEPFAQFEQALRIYRAAYGSGCFVYSRTGSMVSHYMIQARMARVSIVLGPKCPEVGKYYTFPKTEPPLPVSMAYRMAIRHGLAHGATIAIDESSLAWAVAVIQGVGPAYYTHEGMRLLAAASCLLIRASTAVCLGEYRHFFDKGPGQQRLSPMGPIGNPLQYTDTRPDSLSRTEVYCQVYKESWPKLSVYYQYREYLMNVHHDFKFYAWRAAFGGEKWAQCTDATLQLYEAMLPLFRTTTRYPDTRSAIHYSLYVHDTLARVVEAANRVITISHNSGKCLTKIVSQYNLDLISNGATGLTLATSPLTWKVLTTSCLPKRTRTPKVAILTDDTSLPLTE